MYHVVLAIDDNVERSLNQAQALADLPRDPDDLKTTITYAFSFKRPDDSMEDLRSVKEVTEFLDEQGIAYDFEESQDEPAEFVIKTAEALDADLICVGGRKRTPAGKVLFGSVSQQIIINADRPVLVARNAPPFEP
ncbi:universal stress protein [Natrialbaceae archaeon A-gly3]